MKRTMSPICLLFLCLFVLGCTQADDQQQAGNDHGHDHDHGHHHSAENRVPFDSLVIRICGHRDAIKAAFDADKEDEAHAPLHEIGHLIGQLPDAAAETDLEESDWNQVKQASDNLMVSFGKVDARFHGEEEGVKFPEVEKEVQDAISVLQEKVAVLASTSQENQP
ncbi:MAG: hypothetical protein GY768_16355 [Planctomycetaceae bacterium]|nr:hypothetical protein [Planctomycetaceae bacterium]